MKVIYAILLVLVCAGQFAANTVLRAGRVAPKAPKAIPQTLESILQEQEQLHGLPAGLLRAVASVESGMNPAAINHKTKDYGLLQINHKNLHKFGITPKQAMDPVLNAQLGAKIMHYMKQRYGKQNGWECRYNIGTAKGNPLARFEEPESKRSANCRKYLEKLQRAGYVHAK